MNYRFSHLGSEERRRPWKIGVENANLISKENEKIVRFDVFISFFLFRPSSVSSLLEVDWERLILVAEIESSRGEMLGLPYPWSS